MRLSQLAGRFVAVAFAIAAAEANAEAPGVDDLGAIPYLDAVGRAEYRQFLASRDTRAFAISPTGAWGWSSSRGAIAATQTSALARCDGKSTTPCRLYAVNQRVVWQHGDDDARLIAATYSLEATSAIEAAAMPVGFAEGARLPDLALRDASGRSFMLSELNGSTVFLQFAGSWCPACRHELPNLKRFYDQVKHQPGVVVAIVSVGEAPAKTRSWLKRNGTDIPVFDAGMLGTMQVKFADGTRKRMATPTSFLLDPNGVILLRKVGGFRQLANYVPAIVKLAAGEAD